MLTFDELKNKLEIYFLGEVNINDLFIENNEKNVLPEKITEDSLKKYYKSKNNDINNFIGCYRQNIFNENEKKDKAIIEVIMKNNSTANILDFGCGGGLTIKRLSDAGLNVDYADYDSKMLDFVEYLVNNDKCKKLLLDDFVWEKKYDVIICDNVIEHVLNPEKLLFNLISHVNSKGLLFLRYPHIWKEDNSPEHLGFDDFKEKIPNILEQNNFVEIDSSVGCWKNKNKTDIFEKFINIRCNDSNEIKFQTNISIFNVLEIIGLLDVTKQKLISIYNEGRNGKE